MDPSHRPSTPSTPAGPPDAERQSPGDGPLPRLGNRMDFRIVASSSLLFLFVFLFATLILLHGVPLTTFAGWVGHERQRAYLTLNMLADLQKRRLLDIIQELRSDVRVLAANAHLRKMVPELKATLPNTPSREDFGNHLQKNLLKTPGSENLNVWLRTVGETYRPWRTVQLIDPVSGTILASTRRERIGQRFPDRALQALLEGIRRTRQDYVSDSQVTRDPPVFLVGVAIHDHQAPPTAILVMEADIKHLLLPLLKAGGPWRSGETLLVNQNGDYLFPLHFPLADGSRPRSMQHRIMAQSVQLAVEGSEGIIETNDYRQVEVLAGYRHIRLFPEWSWGMVVKLDRRELFAPMEQAVGHFWAVGLAAMVLFISITIYYTGQLTRPLRQLTAAARKIATGDRTVRTGISSKDEVGTLAVAFDSMLEVVTDTLETLEEKVDKRTIALTRELSVRIQKENALKKSQTHLRSLLDNLPQKIFLKDLNLNYVSCNIRLANDLGIRPDKIAGCNDHDFFPLELAKKYRRDDRQVIQSGVTHHIEEDYLQSGRMISVQTVKTPVKDAHGRITGVLGIFWDITERKRAEKALRESERYNRALFEQSPIGLALCRMDGVLVDINPAFAAITGHDMETIKKLTYWQITPEEYADDESRQLESLASTGRYGPYEKEYIHRNGHRVPVRLSGMILEQGGERFIWSSVEDITERKRAEQALAESEARYRALFEETITGMALHEIIIDAEGRPVDYRFLEINARFEILTGLQRKKVVGRTLLEVLPNSEPGWIEKYGQVALTGASIHFEKFSRELDKYFEIFAFRPKPMQFVTIFIDITNRKRAEEEKRLMEQHALRSRQMASIGLLASSVAHEINNPNNSIGFNAAILRAAWEDALPVLNEYWRDRGDYSLGGLPFSEMREKMPRLLGLIEANSDRIKKIVENLKHLAKPDQGDLNEVVDLRQVVEMVHAVLLGQIRSMTDHFSVEIEERLPTVRGNASQLEQVVLNLVMNALESLPDRNHAVSLTVHADDPEQFVILRIRDQGVGIPTDELGKIFDPFFTTKGDTGGTGLGLSISHNIIRGHDGHIEARSRPGQGTTIDVRLPAFVSESGKGEST